MCCCAGNTGLVSRDGGKMVMEGRSLPRISEMGKQTSNIAQEQRWCNPCKPRVCVCDFLDS